MKKGLLILCLWVFIVSSCSIFIPVQSPENTPTEEPASTETPLPLPLMQITSVPNPKITAEKFLMAWENENIIDMYNMLSQASRDAIAYEDFSARYSETAINMTLKELRTEITSMLTNPSYAAAAYRAEFDTKIAGSFIRDMNMNMVLEGSEWKIQWEEGMILPELRGGNRLALDLTVPTRGEIYDITGERLATEARAYAIGVVPAEITRWSGLAAELSKLTGKEPPIIQQLITEAEPYDYVIIGEVPAELVDDRMNILNGYDGIRLSPYSATRFYYEGGIAPHVVGYVQPIGADEADALKRQGYRIDERIGRLGIERWGQEQLAGERGASLYVIDPQGNAVTRLVKTDPLAANALYTTFDADFQYDLARAIAGFEAAVVVLERDTGRVLGMASSPTFNPNLLDFNNQNSFYSQNVLYGTNRPMVNRATQGQYPLGSVFKIIAMAAALESGVYQNEDIVECTHEWNVLQGVTLTDWTLEKEQPPSGTLNLSDGLMRSCNPWFYQIGLDLFRQAGHSYLADMARSFGLGSVTGIGQIEEASGNVENPSDEYSAVQLGIGQSTLLVTPLQVARFVAAVGNGGTLYRPQVIEQIVDPAGRVTYAFEPEVQGKLPISDETMKLVQNAMLSVTRNNRGTAFGTFQNVRYDVYGKTGTAQTAPGFLPDAWFAGYTAEFENGRSALPDIAVAVLVEYVGDGSEFAAPIFRRVLELYYQGRAQTLYRWEAGVYITKTPTPTPTNTPTPVPTRAPWEVTPESEDNAE